jgi:hypothetical protein
MRECLAFSPSFAGGVFVAAGDANGDGRADICRRHLPSETRLTPGGATVCFKTTHQDVRQLINLQSRLPGVRR